MNKSDKINAFQIAGRKNKNLIFRYNEFGYFTLQTSCCELILIQIRSNINFQSTRLVFGYINENELCVYNTNYQISFNLLKPIKRFTNENDCISYVLKYTNLL